jgi:anti-anti-sigma factor
MQVKMPENRAAQDPLKLTRLNAGYGAVCLAAAGEIDFCNAHRLRETIEAILVEPATQQLTLDFADLDYIDSTGASALVVGMRLGQRQRTGFTIINPHGEVLRVLRILGLDDLLAPSAKGWT